MLLGKFPWPPIDHVKMSPQELLNRFLHTTFAICIELKEPMDNSFREQFEQFFVLYVPNMMLPSMGHYWRQSENMDSNLTVLKDVVEGNIIRPPVARLIRSLHASLPAPVEPMATILRDLHEIPMDVRPF
jgi:hypothetical protein